MNENNKVSLERASQLKSRIEDYIKIKDTIPTGIKNEESIQYRKRKILDVLNATEKTGMIINGSYLIE
ncbi:hypothetical protein Q5M85_14250 [Paraclostridium bifermentans]|nr:hypothetical protein [Paraclostridium bifermentans]